MRVLLDCRMADWSGIGRYTTGLVRAIAARGDVEIVQLLAKEGAAPVADAIFLRANAHPFTPEGGLELGRVARLTACDVTHCLHFPTPFPARHPLVVTLHDLTPLMVPGTMQAFPHGLGYRIWNRRASRVADRIITPSHFTATDVERLFPAAAGKVRVTPEAADDLTTGPLAPMPEDLGAFAGERYALSMGNTKPHKDLPTLLRAFESVASVRPGLSLLLAGTDVPGYAASVLGDSPAVSRVHFTGRVDDAVLRRLYADAAVFAFPSRYEGFGLPPLEAMGMGTPVVCADATSLPEVVGDAALLVPVGDADALARGLASVLDDGAVAARLVAAGRARAASFSWENTARDTLAVYREVLAR